MLSTDQMHRIVRTFSPRHPEWVDVNREESVEDCTLFTMRELEELALTMKNKKVPGPDGISAEVYKLVFRQRPRLLFGAFNACLKGKREESRLVGYAALVAGRTFEPAQSRLGILMLKGWITADGFCLELEKTEVVILTTSRIPTLSPISLGELTIESKPAVKYISLMLDSKMCFFE